MSVYFCLKTDPSFLKLVFIKKKQMENVKFFEMLSDQKPEKLMFRLVF